VTIVVIDIDCFKGVNDNHGHAVGDETLVRVASVLRSAVRVGDLAVRIGGDEFMLVLASTEAHAARRRSETILQAVKAQAWDEVSRGLSVTASAGLACGEPNALTAIISAADEALYRSKAVGGDLVSEG
jgi:diguanylate cyclase (GGDEF)-like protein